MRAIGTSLLCFAALAMVGCAEQRSTAQHAIPFSAMQIQRCLPIYPNDAHYAGYGGETIVAFTANLDGTTRDVALDQSSGHPLLDEVSLEIVRRCNVVQALQVTPGGHYKVLYGFRPPNHIYVERPIQE